MSIEKNWKEIGVVVGTTSTDTYEFVISDLSASVGDIVITKSSTPMIKDVLVWGRIVWMERTNPTFPSEFAAELARENLDMNETIGMSGSEHLRSEVQIMGCTDATESDAEDIVLEPLNYPVKPANKVMIPDVKILNKLLSGNLKKDKPIPIGTLINRNDVEIFFKGESLCARHLAVLAQTGGGKTVACRTIIAGLAKYGQPMIIFDPHGDYLGLSKYVDQLKEVSGNKDLKVKLMSPKLLAKPDKVADAIYELVMKLGLTMTEAQVGVFESYIRDGGFVSKLNEADNNLLNHIETLAQFIQNNNPPSGGTRAEASKGPIQRKLRIIINKLKIMETTNRRLQDNMKKHGLKFEDMPDSKDNPDKFIRQNQISILYLGGYERVVQSTIVSIILEDLFNDRSSMQLGRIPAFSAIVEEAHNFVPSKGEEKSESPSLLTIRRLLTEGRKFGTGVVLISQRPGRLDETTLAQCNSFLVLKLVNPRDQSWVRNVMEQMSEQDAKWLKAFGKGQGFISGAAVKFPLQIYINYHKELEWDEIGRENFIQQNLDEWSGGGKKAAEQSDKDNERVSKILKK